jgi:hypothetical protein
LNNFIPVLKGQLFHVLAGVCQVRRVSEMETMTRAGLGQDELFCPKFWVNFRVKI